MEETELIVEAKDADQHLMAAAFHILKALEARGSVTDDVDKILSDLSAQFTSMTKINHNEMARGSGEDEYRLRCVQKKILNLQPNRLNIRESGQELVDYLQAIEEVQRLRKRFRSMPFEGDKEMEDLDSQAQYILQIAMEKLQEVLVCVLGQNKHCFEQDYMSFHSCEESTISTEDDSVGGSSRRESNSSEPEEYLMDFVHPDVIPYLKSIADTMFSLNYDHEFCQAFIVFWRCELEEYLAILNVEHNSIEDVLKMEWECLHSKIKIWCRAAKSILGFYLVSEKRLFDQVFGEAGSVSSKCFIDATKSAVFCLLNLGQAVAIGPLGPERLFSLLDMYEVLADHLQIVNTLFAGEGGSIIRTEVNKLLKNLSHTAMLIFSKFGNHVASNPSTVPTANGQIAPLTKYVMNYITLLEDYGDTLNLLLAEETKTRSSVPSEENSSDMSGQLSHHLHSFVSILEKKLEEKSNLYGENSLSHIFMMNNIHYMVKKIKHSKVRKYFSDEWMREHMVKYKQLARAYERVTWSTVLSHLKDDGTKAKAILKQRCRDFTMVFESKCKIQREWCIPDLQLREELRISISQAVTNAYRAFLSRLTACSVCDKYIRYSAEQLESSILDLFEGPYKSSNHPRRR